MDKQLANNKMPRKKAPLFFCAALVSVIMAFSATHFIELVNLKKLAREQALLDKKPIYHKVADELSRVSLISNTTNNANISINFANQDKITVEQKTPTEDEMDYYQDVDLTKVLFATVDGRLTIDFSDAFEVDTGYHGVSIYITLPRRDLTLDIDNNFYYGSVIENAPTHNDDTVKPINLALNASSANFKGKFSDVTIKQTDMCQTINCYSFFEKVTINKLSIFSQKVMYGKHLVSPFSISLTDELQVNSIELHVPAESEMQLKNLDLVHRIKWYETDSFEVADTAEE